MKKLLVVCGPTGTGKTALALGLAKKFDGELVSADSRQIYKGMDIGTGKEVGDGFVVRGLWFVVSIEGKKYKVPQYLIQGVPVWMYDVVEPNEEFTAYHYQVLARSVIEDIWRRNKLPILVGGSGFYIDAVTGRIKLSSVGSNSELRKELKSWPLDKLQEELRRKNHEVWEGMNQSDRRNSRRLIRKIEIVALNFIRSGLAVGTAKRWQGQILSKMYVLTIGLRTDLSEVYKRIDARVKKREEEGILVEIQRLLNNGYKWDDPGMNALGYREWKEYFENLELKDKIVQRWKWDEHGYARRQMSWLRRNRDIYWFDIGEADYINRIEVQVGKWYTKDNESK